MVKNNRDPRWARWVAALTAATDTNCAAVQCTARTRTSDLRDKTTRGDVRLQQETPMVMNNRDPRWARWVAALTAATKH